MQYFTIGEPLIMIYVTKYNEYWGCPNASIRKWLEN